MTTLRDRLRRDLVLIRFSWAIQDHPQASALTREVRRELAATAAEVGLGRALDDLGNPRVLADGYLEALDRPIPRWTAGTVWGAIALAFALYTGLAYGFGTLDALADLAGDGTLSARRVVLGATFDYTAGPAELSTTWSLSWGWFALHVLVFALPFALGARIWRLRFRR
ncbi:hypothetical protein [Cellulomonas denverensis]|uniref:Uncharacterized protein n=1 Tax=Cellulomonas denverensis TaxID=264297 RepID=A0A7X6KWM9_9CELL|nr:hypothetical protein [Cellulomonas denverensis]NKY23631.1 hypothetical protein [Cellulomonas denverensis]GIG26889.1 hypothetical protein Cde04nite_31330 [Cellulomonas denverensis]